MSANGVVCKEKLIIGKAFVSGSDLLCALPTTTAVAVSEETELRAYKLGKKKCSYNQVELLFYDLNGESPIGMKISEAIETCIGFEVEDVLKESCLKFNVRFLNNMRMNLYIYLVYANAHLKMNDASPTAESRYYWMPVTRSNCKRGCRGPVIRGLQRFGKMPRRTEQDSWKEPRHLYIAIDEASTHLCVDPAEAPKFRFLLAAYSDQYELLGTTVSSSIRVLSNNDAPRGAASLKVHFNLQEGWKQDMLQTPRLSSRSDPISKDIELYPQLVDGDQTGNESVIVVHGLSAKKTQEYSVKRHEPETNLKEDNHSLNELCERLFEICASKMASVISLRTLATLLGTRRKRIYEIFNVLQCVLIVEQKREREKYTWLGATKISSAIRKLKQEAGLSKKPYTREKFENPTEEMVENPMRELTEEFIQLFLVNEKRPITLEFAMDALLDPRVDPQTHRCKMRRLTEIARIFTVLNLIRTERSSDSGISSGSLFSWRGAPGVKQRLVIADSGKKIWKRRCAGINPKQKAVKNKKLDFNISELAVYNMPRLVSETEDDDEILPSLEMECNRLIKRPRLCATVTNFTTEKNCASILSKGSITALSNPEKIDRYHSTGSDSANTLSPLKNLDHNDADAVNYEVAAILMCLSSSDQLNANNKKSSPQVVANPQIEAETQQKPSTENEIEEKSNCLSNATAELCSKYVEGEVEFPQSDQAFNPLFHLQQVFSISHIAQLQAENQGFMSDYFRYSRQLYQKCCGANVSANNQKNLFKPVPIRAVYNTNFVDILAGGQDQM